MFIGIAGRHALDRVIWAFQRIFFTTSLFLFAIGVFEGVLFSSLFVKDFLPWWVQLPGVVLGGAAVCWLAKNQERRIDQLERDRANWRKGMGGEFSVAETLKGLPDTFVVLNGLKAKTGDLDHVVVGPTGLFFIETKNWRGLVTADQNGELLCNGRTFGKSAVRSFVARGMTVLEQLKVLTGEQDIYFRAVMVFPRSHVDAPFGKTGRAHCLTDEHLCGYIENPAFSQKLSKDRVRTLVRGLEGIARMEPEFRQPLPSQSSPSIVSRETAPAG